MTQSHFASNVPCCPELNLPSLYNWIFFTCTPSRKESTENIYPKWGEAGRQSHLSFSSLPSVGHCQASLPLSHTDGGRTPLQCGNTPTTPPFELCNTRPCFALFQDGSAILCTWTFSDPTALCCKRRRLKPRSITIHSSQYSKCRIHQRKARLSCGCKYKYRLNYFYVA